MEGQRKEPQVIDAEYSVVGGKRNKALTIGNVNIHPVVVGGVKLAVLGGFWMVKQFGALVVAGVTSMVSGITEANRELSHDYRKFDAGVDEVHRGGRGKSVEKASGGNDYYFIQKKYKRDRPIWYIPTKEEEYLDRLNDRG